MAVPGRPEVWTASRVSDIGEYGVEVGEERIRARTVLWAAGVTAGPVNRTIDCELDARAGRLCVAI
jgi:NADH dehydrogenase